MAVGKELSIGHGAQAAETELMRQKRANSIEAILQRHLASPDSLSIGEQAKIAHLLPAEQAADIRTRLNEAGSSFWAEWSRFRCGVTDTGELTPDTEPNFYHVVGLLPVLNEFSRFATDGVRPRRADTSVVVLDLMGGTAPIAKHFQRGVRPDGYVLIDGNPRIKTAAEDKLASLQVPNAHVLIHDLSDGLPENLGETIDEIKQKNGAKPTQVLAVSNWGLTYLTAPDFLGVVNDIFDPRYNGDNPTSLAFNMLTDGKFDPAVLEQRFKSDIVPPNIFTCQFNALKRAKASVPSIRRFGEEIKSVVPIWYPGEIKTLLEENRFNVDKVDDTLLWGQSTAIRVTGKDL